MNDMTQPAEKDPAILIPALRMSEDELVSVLFNSFYPGADIASIKMVIAYCRTAILDPMQKPVHIVPMWDSKSGRMRDVIMPGIGLYRTQAARSGSYAGVSEPEFGPEVTEKIGGMEITFPLWCKVTVSRLLPNGMVAQFTAQEFWKENYAVKGGKEKSVAPNAMWKKRPCGQIAKCAQAQALRTGFPELGAAPTAEEMEGKSVEDWGGETIDNETGEVTKNRPPMPEAKTEQPTGWGGLDKGPVAEKPADVIEGECKDVTDDKPVETKVEQAPANQGASPNVSPGQAANIRNKAKTLGKDEAALCQEFGVTGNSFDGCDQTQWLAIKAKLSGN